MSSVKVFSGYLALYIVFSLVIMVVSWVGDGFMGLISSICGFLLGAYFVGLFRRLLYRLNVTIPMVGQVGPETEEMEWLIHTVIIGVVPMLILFIGTLLLIYG